MKAVKLIHSWRLDMFQSHSNWSPNIVFTEDDFLWTAARLETFEDVTKSIQQTQNNNLELQYQLETQHELKLSLLTIRNNASLD